MTPLTTDTLRAVAPHAPDTAAPALEAAMQEFGIDTPFRRAHFLGQCCLESDGFTTTLEHWGPTHWQQAYEGNAHLGNSEQGDGFRFRGRGYLQTTGRANYERTAAALGLPLLNQPELLEQPSNAARAAGWYWQVHNLNPLADAGNVEAITRAINGKAMLGLDLRRRYTSSFYNVLVGVCA